MGKAARKLNKALQKNKAADAAREIQQYRERVSALINEGKFSTAVDVLAEAATKKIKDVELMYDTAYCYFMVGDYERAGRWISNVLTVSPNNKAARILLGRLCLLQDREDDGLAVFDYVLANWRYQLPEAELQEIGETLEYYGREVPEKIRANYPHVAELLEENDTLGAPEPAQPAGSSALEAVREKLAALKKLTEKAAAKQETEAEVEETATLEQRPVFGETATPEQRPVGAQFIEPTPLSATEPVAPAPQPEPAKPVTAADTLARLKAKLAALKANVAPQEEKPAAVLEPMNEQPVSEQSSASEQRPIVDETPILEQRPVGAQFIEPTPLCPTEPDDSATEETDELEPEEITLAEADNADATPTDNPKSLAEMNAQAEAKRDEVMAMALSLEEKIGALNNFAGAYFFAGAWHAAEVLLQAALKIDPKRPETIRNMAMLLKESGNTEAALQCAARLPIMDFALLALLRDKD